MGPCASMLQIVDRNRAGTFLLEHGDRILTALGPSIVLQLCSSVRQLQPKSAYERRRLFPKRDRSIPHKSSGPLFLRTAASPTPNSSAAPESSPRIAAFPKEYLASAQISENPEKPRPDSRLYRLDRLAELE